MKIKYQCAFKKMAWLIAIYVSSMIGGLIILFVGVRVLVYFIEGVSVEYDFSILLKAVKIGTPLGLLGGMGHWIVYKLNIR